MIFNNISLNKKHFVVTDKIYQYIYIKVSQKCITKIH